MAKEAINFSDLPKFEEICIECNGKGQVKYEDKRYKSLRPCSKCIGRGKILTEFGAAVVELLREYSPWQHEINDLQSQVNNLDYRGSENY